MSLTEIWKPTYVTDKYSVSNLGRVRNNHTGRILKSWNNDHGYKKVMIPLNGKPKLYSIHRLVAEAFCLKLGNQTEVDHIDGDKSNNVAENLRWVTRSENMQYASQHGKHNSRKLTVQQVREIREKYKSGLTSFRELGREYNVSDRPIACIIHRISYKWVD